MKKLFICSIFFLNTLVYASGMSAKDEQTIALLKQLFAGEKESTVLKIDPNDPCKLKSQPSEEELKMAKVAWKYFENNFQENTGLMNAANKYKSASVWDWANGVYGLFSAKKLGVISQEKFETMLHQFLRTMQEMKMFNNELPNKTYNTKHAYMSNYKNKQIEDGTGWSVADIARLLASLNVVYQCEYNMRPAVEKLMVRYRYCRLLTTYGDMYGASYKEDKLSLHKETMTGYEEYLARSMELWEHDADEARRYKFVKEVSIYDIPVPTDTRTFYSNFVGSESYWNTAFDYGPDDNESGYYINNIYKVQEARYHNTGQLTAITEDNTDTKPSFLYNTIYTNGEPFKVINHGAEDYQELKSVSTKAGLAMKPLFGTPYADKIFNYLKSNYHPEKGYYAGIYETRAGSNKAVTLNTNSNVLKSLLYSNIGALQKLAPIENRGTYDYYRNKVNNFKCLPSEEKSSILEPFSGDNTRELNTTELNQTLTAWKYFENNYHFETGFVNGSNKHKIVSVSDIAMGLKATLWAKGLDIIPHNVFKERIDTLMETLSTLSLFNDELPNSYYHAITAQKVSSSGEESEKGSGYKLYDIAHLITALYHLQNNHPEYQDWVFSIVSQYDFSRAIDGQTMNNCEYYGVDSKGKEKEYLKSIKDPAKEYYIFAALRLFNFPSYSHFIDEKNLHYEPMYHYEVPMGYNYKIANGESYLWAMLELPYYSKYKHYSSNIYLALKDRYTITGKYATSSVESIDKKPNRIFNDLYNNNRGWSDFDKKGRNQKKRNVLSTKSAFIYDALYGFTDDYSNTLMNKINTLYNDEKGWYGGFYTTKFKKNRSLTASTNTAILASLYYKKVGNFYYHGKEDLQDRINLHDIKENNTYTLESKDDAFFYKLKNRFKDFDKNVTDVIRVVRKGENFVMHYGIFKTFQDAQNYLNAHDYRFRDFNVTATPIVDDKDFLLSNRYYNYDYRLPYKNTMIDKPNDAFMSYYQVYTDRLKEAKTLNAKERSLEKEKIYKEKKAEEKKAKAEEKKRKKLEKKVKKNTKDSTKDREKIKKVDKKEALEKEKRKKK